MNDLIQINVAGPDTSTGRPCTSSKKHKGNGNGQNAVRDNKAKSFVQGWKDIAVAVRADEPAKKAKRRNPADCNDRIDLPKGVASQQVGKEMQPAAVVPAVLDVPLGAAARAKLKMKERLSTEIYIRTEEALRHIKLLGLRHDEVRFRTVPVNPKDVYLCRSFKGKEGERDVEDTIKLALVPRVLLGAAAFVLPNSGGNKKADITEVRSIRAEWDDQPIEWQIRAWKVLGLPEPTFQVATGGKSVHSYWVLREGVEPIRGELAARRVVKLACDKGFPSDPAVVSRSQPMRLAGSLYIAKPAKKGEPVNPLAGKAIGYAQILDGADEKRRYSIEELEAVLPELTKVESEAVGRVRAAAGDVSHSGEEDPCPICGRDSDADCTIFDNTDGVVVVVCYRGKSFSPPTDLTLGDVIEGKVDPSTRWAYTGDSAMGSFGRPAAKFKQVGPEVALHNAKQEQQALTEVLASPRRQQDAGAVASPPEEAPTQVEAPALVVTGNPYIDWETAVFWAESEEERAALMAEGFAIAEGVEGKDIKGRTVFLCWSSRAMVKVPKVLKDLALKIARVGGNPRLIHLPCEVPQARGGLDPEISANTLLTFLQLHGREALLLLADRAKKCCKWDQEAKKWSWEWSHDKQGATIQAIIAWSVFKEHYVVEGAEERLYEWEGTRWLPLPGKASTAIEQPLQRWVAAMQWRSELTLGSKAIPALIAELRDHPRRRALCLDPVVQHGVLPMRNGVVRLSDGELLPHDRKYGNTWVLPYEFRPDELPVKTLACINRLLPKPHHQRLFRAACANALRRLGAKGFVELTGVGDSGKSALARLVEALVGKECTASSQLHLMEDKNQRFETLKARGAALLLFAECQDYAGPLERLKAFTGGDTIVAERKNSTERFDFTFRGLVMLVGNSAVKAKDDSSAVFNRRRSIHLDQAVPLAERRDMLSWRVDHWEGELADELGAFVVWILAMDPQEAKEAMEETGGLAHLDDLLDAQLTNPLAEWAEQHLIFDDTLDEDGKYHQLKIGTMSPGEEYELDAEKFKVYKFAYPSYRDWMAANGLKGNELSLRRFKSSLVGLLRDQLGLPLPAGLMTQPPYRTRDGARIPMLRMRIRSADAEIPGLIRFALQRNLGCRSLAS
jgi:putative DNA primase/helicase